MSAGSPSRPEPGSFRELWRVAVPLVLSSGSLSLMHVIDRIFLTRYSNEALAAAMPAGILHWTVISVFIGTATYVNTFVAQYEGADKKDRVVASVWQGVYMATVCGVCLTAVFVPLAGPIFTLVGHNAAVQQLEVQYFSIMCFGAVPMIMAASLSAFFSGRGETQVVMFVNFGITSINVLFDYCLIFGIGPFPEMGVRGAAIATVFSQTCGVLMYAVMIWRARNHDGYAFLLHRRFDRELFGRLMRYGLPTGFQFLSDILAFAMFIFLIGRIGTNELAATNLAFNMNSMAFIPMFGIGTAVMTLVGKRIGEGRPQLAVRTTWIAFGLCSAYMLSFAAVYLFLPEVVLYPYVPRATPERFAAIEALVIPLLRFVALYSFFDGMAIVFSCAVRGAGDTRFSLLFTLVAGWSLMVVPVWYIWNFVGPDLFAGWTAVTVYIVVAGFGFLIRFQMGQWKTMRVIEADDHNVAETPDESLLEFAPAMDGVEATVALAASTADLNSTSGNGRMPCTADSESTDPPTHDELLGSQP